MANQIKLAKSFTNLLDKVYQAASVTANLNTPDDLIRKGANAGEIQVPKISVDGLGNYSRNDGYVKGSVSLDWETVKFNYDRGRTFQVDSMDNQETVNLAFGQLAAEFMRTKVAPEKDAFTFATLSGKDGVSSAQADLATGDAVLKALAAALDEMDTNEVSEGRNLYITAALLRAVEQLDTTKSREVLGEFSRTVKVPTKRFYDKIELQDGKTNGQEIGGFKAPVGACALNFVIVEPSAIIKFDKHVANNIISPEDNQSADAFMLKYREYGLVDVYENKTAGIYVHKKKTAVA